MRMPLPHAVLLLLAFVVGAPAYAETTLARGVRQVREGDLETAITTLNAAVREAAGDRAREADLAQAHLHLGVAYALQDQEKAALASFREALRLNSSLELTADLYPARVLRLLASARAAALPASAAPSPSGGAPEALPARLVVDFEHDLEQGRLQVFVDADMKVDEELDSRSRRRMLLLHRRKGGLEATLDVVPGHHAVRVVVRWGDDSEKAEALTADFSAGITRRLLVKLKGRFRKSLSLEWG